MSDVKITSVEKTKDPKRVEAGKKLGAISKQAKEKKAQKHTEDIGIDKSEFPTFDTALTAAAVITGIVGIAMYYKSSSPKESPKEDHTVVQAKQAKQATPVRRELDTLDYKKKKVLHYTINEF